MILGSSIQLMRSISKQILIKSLLFSRSTLTDSHLNVTYAPRIIIQINATKMHIKQNCSDLGQIEGM